MAGTMPPEGWRSMAGDILHECSNGSRFHRALIYLRDSASKLFWVVVMFLVCELLIWGIYTALHLAGVEFLSSIVGMVVVFLAMLLLARLAPRSEVLYGKYVKAKVDFINMNLGIGFPVPMVMFSDGENLEKVGVMFGNFFATGGVFWIAVFLIAFVFMLPVLKVSRTKNQDATNLEEGRPNDDTIVTTSTATTNPSEGMLNPPQQTWTTSRPTLTSTDSTTTAKESSSMPSSAATSITAVEIQPIPSRPSHLRTWASSIISALCVIVIGLPVSYGTNEDRPLDLSVLWLSWVVSVKAQATLRRLNIPRVNEDVRRILATFLNPVLLTTVSMAAYTRIKASVRDIPVETVLATFSSGTPLAQLWSGNAPNKSPAYGAGDAALSLLEVGIVVWGFKLHECRRQLFSFSGLVVVLVSVLSAGFSAFVSVAMARAMGIGARECLSYASRSTTLALAKPSTTALGGSEMVNAALVVGNGIFGQLLTPWILRAFTVRSRSADDAQDDREEGQSGAQDRDSAVEVATGATVGMNGAAMGVSYLYERESRAAPYAALAMTAFGVATTVLSSVEPFQEALKKIAGL